MSILEDPYSALMGGGAPMTAPDAPQPEPETDMSAVEHLRMAIEHAQAALVMEPDDEDSQSLSKVVAGLYAIVSARQKERDQTMGNPSLLRTLRRSG